MVVTGVQKRLLFVAGDRDRPRTCWPVLRGASGSGVGVMLEPRGGHRIQDGHHYPAGQPASAAPHRAHTTHRQQVRPGKYAAKANSSNCLLLFAFAR